MEELLNRQISRMSKGMMKEQYKVDQVILLFAD
jgi:hypothetical protein